MYRRRGGAKLILILVRTDSDSENLDSDSQGFDSDSEDFDSEGGRADFGSEF